MSSFYKYCPIYSEDEFKNEYAIKNLSDSVVTFSTRDNFNDLFDSEVKLIRPTRKQLKAVASQLPSRKRVEFKRVFLEDDWENQLDAFSSKLKNLFDGYLYYCVTTNSTSNLMWSHYANSHKGFCIEWDSSKIRAEKVFYREKIPKFNLIDLVKLHSGVSTSDDVVIVFGNVYGQN